MAKPRSGNTRTRRPGSTYSYVVRHVINGPSRDVSRSWRAGGGKKRSTGGASDAPPFLGLATARLLGPFLATPHEGRRSAGQPSGLPVSVANGGEDHNYLKIFRLASVAAARRRLIGRSGMGAMNDGIHGPVASFAGRVRSHPKTRPWLTGRPSPCCPP